MPHSCMVCRHGMQARHQHQRCKHQAPKAPRLQADNHQCTAPHPVHALVVAALERSHRHLAALGQHQLLSGLWQAGVERRGGREQVHCKCVASDTPAAQYCHSELLAASTSSPHPPAA